MTPGAITAIETSVPSIRRRVVNDAPVRRSGDYVLYWMIATRRTRSNYALDLAVDYALALERPLLVFEPLRCGYRWASDRLHTFVLEGMRANRDALAGGPVGYFPYVERELDEGKGLLHALGEKACVVLTDDLPGFFQPRMVEAAGRTLSCRLETIDSAGLFPVAATDRVFTRAYDFRRHLQKTLPDHLSHAPRRDPLLRGGLPPWVGRESPRVSRWPPASETLLQATPSALANLPIDHEVPPSPVVQGGSIAAQQRLRAFVSDQLPRYGEDRNHPDDDASSGLSPYLHFGHLGAHEVLEAVLRDADWDPSRLVAGGSGAKSGWWGLPATHEAFLDELVTWREIGLNVAAKLPAYDRYGSLPDWAKQTLAVHRGDPRPVRYTFEQLARAETYDEIWNAAQRQLLLEGCMHNYLRMLWGKKILEWSETPEEALETMIELNNRWALDGRDANSYSGIFWVLGRFDRAWGPERDVFGKIRYMSSESTRKKLRLRAFLRRFGREGEARARVPAR